MHRRQHCQTELVIVTHYAVSYLVCVFVNFFNEFSITMSSVKLEPGLWELKYFKTL